MKRIIRSLAEVKRRVKKAGFKIISEEPLRDGYGIQIITDHGHVINVYYTNSVVVQGNNQQQMRDILTKKE